MLNEADFSLSTEALPELHARRDAIAGLLAQARRQEAESASLRRAGKSSDASDLALAETIVEIRAQLKTAVDYLEKSTGTQWTPGLRVIHFACELRNAQGTLHAQGVIFDRFKFAVEQVAAASSPNETEGSPES